MGHKLSYKKTRNTGEIFSATFSFIRQNFKPLYTSLILMAGPFLLLGNFVFNPLFGYAGPWLNGLFSFDMANLMGIWLTVMCSLFLGLAVYTVVLNKNIIAHESLAEGEKLRLSMISRNFFSDFLRVFLNMFLFTLVLIFLTGCLIAIFSVIGGLLFSSSITSAFLILFLIAFLIILLPVLSFIPIAALFVCQRDHVSILPALSKVFGYIKNNFWSTWLFCFLALVTYSLAVGIVRAPMLIVNIISYFTRVNSDGGFNAETGNSFLPLIWRTISLLLTYVVMSLYYLLNIFYFTSIEEKKEGTRLIESINQIV